MVDDVEQYKIDEIASIKTGGKDTQNAIEDGIFPFYVRSDKIERINTYSFNGEAVLTSGDGVGVGKIFHYINGKFDFHQRVYAIHNFNDQLVDGKFFYYQFSNNFYDRVMAMSAKSSVDSVRREMIADMSILLFPKKEQTAIAKALSDMDGLILASKKLIAKREAIKQGLMQELLTGKRRLPGFDGEWEFSKLKDVCNTITDGTHYTPKYVASGVPFYSVENVTRNDFKNVKYISETEHLKLIKRCRPEKGDILLTRIGTLGDTKYIDWNVNASIYVSLALLRANSILVTKKYLDAYSKSRTFVNEIVKRALVNATPQKINMNEIGEVPIYHPLDFEEQKAISELLTDFDNEIENLKQKLQKLINLKQGMMQELLTGRIRLVQTEKEYAIKEESLPMAAEPSNEVSWLDSERLNKEKEAAILAMLVAKSDIALGRFRYQKLMYLFHRKSDNAISGWLNKAAGPYNHDLRYGGVEDFVINRGWCRDISNDKEHPRYQKGTNYNQAKQQYLEHYSRTTINWLKEYFFFKTDDELELLATADKAKLSRARNGLSADWTGVKQYIAQEPEWKDKLKKEHFSNDNLQSAVVQLDGLFEYE